MDQRSVHVCKSDQTSQEAEKAAKAKEAEEKAKKAKAKQIKAEFGDSNKQWEQDKKGMDSIGSKEQLIKQEQPPAAKVGDSNQAAVPEKKETVEQVQAQKAPGDDAVVKAAEAAREAAAPKRDTEGKAIT